ncbi:MAG: hypothetical protein PHO37_02525, partial [Kiritimatiellae bacterium]|nr:hypothetical protein [Kiritimatiellia bacterium]
YIRRYAVDDCEVYPPLCGGWSRSISAAMRWMVVKYIRRYAVDGREVYPPLCGGWLRSISAISPDRQLFGKNN